MENREEIDDDNESGIEEDDDMEENGKEEEKESKQEEEMYLPGKPMEEGEELTFDKSAYVMYHSAETGSPCLSFDFLSNKSDETQNEYPMSCDIVCGTQSHGKPNQILIMKMVNLTKIEEDSDSEDSYIEEEDGKEPILHTLSFKHTGDVNRIRYTQLDDKKLAASWSSVGNVQIWDLTKHSATLKNNRTKTQHQTLPDVKPLFSFSGHQMEGYALDWSPTVPGRLATGACNKNIHIWQPTEAGTWHVDQRPLSAHTDSVEDIQWSPNERNVFASCSVDKTVRIWDANVAGAKGNMMTVNAHESDVNVISWNRNDPFIVSGGDDGIIKIWDLRQFKEGTPVATFKHHSAPITSVEWHPSDSTVFAASGADNQVSIWDLAVEKDDENIDSSVSEVPPQLLFIHMGQTDIKEIHWHNKLPGVLMSTAATGFNIFKTISV